MSCARCLELLNEALNLCVRARTMDSMDRRAATLAASVVPEEWESSGLFAKHVERHNIVYPERPIHTRSATVHLWVQEQYESDLAEWERSARKHLTQGCHAQEPESR